MNKHRTAMYVGLAAALSMSVVSAQGAVNTWVGASGNWSDSANWDVNGVPATDGTADIVLTTTTPNSISTEDASWGTALDRKVNSVLFTGPGRIDLHANSTLNIGSSISWDSSGNSGQNSGTYNFFNPTAAISITNTPNVAWQGSITTTNNTQIDKVGTGELRFFGGTTGSNVSFKLSNGAIRFARDTQYDRLGTVGLTVLDTNNTTLGFNSTTANEGAVVRQFATPITFDGVFTNRQFFFNPGAGILAGNTSFRLNVDAGWSSTTDLGGRISAGSIWLTGVGDDRSQTWFNADSSGLTATAAAKDFGANSRSVIYIRGGYFVLNHANALGAGNNLSVLIGEANPTGGHNGTLLATNGNNVSGDIAVKSGGGNSTTGDPLTVAIGLEGAGGVTYSGSLFTATDNVGYKVPTLALTAVTGGTATFTGVIQDKGTGVFASSVHIVGGGKIVLANTSTYTSTTTVSENSTLALDGSLTQSNVVVQLGSTLQGTGLVANGVNVAGVVGPGNSIGMLTVGSAVVSGSLAIELDAASASDLFAVVGDFDITNATLDLTDLGSAFDGSTYLIATYGSLTGSQFSAINGLANGYSVDYNYQGNNGIALVAIPEPASVVLLTLGSLMLVFRERRKS